jgi:hypothetical protein
MNTPMMAKPTRTHTWTARCVPGSPDFECGGEVCKGECLALVVEAHDTEACECVDEEDGEATGPMNVVQ